MTSKNLTIEEITEEITYQLEELENLTDEIKWVDMYDSEEIKAKKFLDYLYRNIDENEKFLRGLLKKVKKADD